MLQRLLRRLTYVAYRDELNELAVRYGREMGLLRRKITHLAEAYAELEDAYEELLLQTHKERDGA
jgi:hypothetical protein